MNAPAKSLTPVDEKREVLRDKIVAAKERLAERSLTDYARDARDNATGFVREHPIGTVGAALALGVVLAAIIPGPGQRLRKKVTKQVSNRASPLAAMAAEMGLAYASGFLDIAGSAARTGQDKLEDIGDSIGDTTRKVRRETKHRVSKATDDAASLTRKVKKTAGRAARDARARIS